jgi:hypothetical protein
MIDRTSVKSPNEPEIAVSQIYSKANSKESPNSSNKALSNDKRGINHKHGNLIMGQNKDSPLSA